MLMFLYTPLDNRVPSAAIFFFMVSVIGKRSKWMSDSKKVICVKAYLYNIERLLA